jgi:hypothetical protein
MIIQITITKNELFLLKEMLPHWQKYADGFVFMDDMSDDGTYEFLNENKEKYNILKIMRTNWNKETLDIESDTRQILYDEGLKYSNKIICLDTDEYIDGKMSKQELENILDTHKDIMIGVRWVQYADKDKIRIDGVWRESWTPDRIAAYSERGIFKPAQMHSEHLPEPKSGKRGNIILPHLFIAHLQWLDKKTVAVKQYFWKVTDYVKRTKFGASTISPDAYDRSVNNFKWEYSDFEFPLKVPQDVYSRHDIKNSFKYKYIKENIKLYNIPNLNDWDMGIHEDNKGH